MSPPNSVPASSPPPSQCPPRQPRRLSQPLLPIAPSPGIASATLHNLRGALLGYLGEVEAAIRGRAAGDPLDGLMPGEVGDVGAGQAEWEGDEEWDGEGREFDAEGTGLESVDNVDDTSGREWAAASGREPGQGDTQGLRRRHGKENAIGTAKATEQSTSIAIDNSSPQYTHNGSTSESTSTSITNHDALLNHLSTLKDDVKAYLPALPSSFRLPAVGPGSAVSGSQEWLRTLPGRLRQVEMALPGGMSLGFPFSAYSTHDGLGAGAGGQSQDAVGATTGSAGASANASGAMARMRSHSLSLGTGALSSARQRVLDMVRSVLPSDEWEGWERLGWEETREMEDHDVPRLTRSVSHPTHAFGGGGYGRDFQDDDEDEDEDDEGDEEEDDVFVDNGNASISDTTSHHPHTHSYTHTLRTSVPPRFLFPNRTPAAVEAIARRRTMRSRSLGSAGYAGRWAGVEREDHRTPPMTAGWLRTDRDSKRDEDGEQEEANLQNERDRNDYFSSPHHPNKDEITAHDVSTDINDNAVIDPTEPLIGGIADPTTSTSTLTRRVKIDPNTLTTSPKSSSSATKPALLARHSSSVQPGYEWELGPSVMEALKLSRDGQVLLDYEQLPVHWRNNEHILTGYRFIPLHASTGPIPLIKSAFAWHNETVNIQSHFIPTCIIMCIIPFIIYSTPLVDAHPLDTAILVLYLIAAISCMSTSASWHVLSGCASKKWFEWGACVDYIGISWLIAASFGTVVYDAFYCRPNLVFLYLGTNAACGALGSYLPFQRWFNLRKMKPWRIAFFLFLNFAMFAPMLQLFWQHGLVRGGKFCVSFIPSILSYVAGLLFYAFHFPECVWPGRFDTWFASHQLWHAGIVIAIILHYRAVLVAHEMRYDLSCAVPGAGVNVAEVVGGWVGRMWGRVW